jgi:hypothetical protein
MKIGLIIVFCLLGIIGTLGLICVTAYFQAATLGNESENTIEASWEQSENVLSNFKLKVMEMAQVTTMSVDDKVRIVDATMGGRYGKDGLKAAWAWIKENNINADDELYQKLQRTFEAGRNDFEKSQKILVDTKRSYKNDLGNPWSGFWLRMVGYPRLNVGYPRGTQDDYKIISSKGARNAFETGMDEVTKVR